MHDASINKRKQLKVFETFAGIGAQHKAISNIKDETKNFFKVAKISEWDARAIIAYSRIHHSFNVDEILKNKNLFEERKLDEWLRDKTFSLDSKKKANIISKSFEFKKELVASCIFSNCLPNILEVKGEDLKDIDILTYSFPCQGLSIANMGRGKGIKKNTDSTSNLIWQIERILSEAKAKKITLPKYLLLENVTQLEGKKHNEDYKKWNELLDEKFKYKTFIYKLNALDYGMVQNRRRLFAISILEPSKKLSEEKIKNILKKEEKKLEKKFSKKIIKDILFPKITDKLAEEYNLCTPKATSSRKKMAKSCKDLSSSELYQFSTLTTKQDRNPNLGMINVENSKRGHLDKRFITPREAYRIMGFDNGDFEKLRSLWIEEGILTKESLYRQAGNSIAVKVLEAIFKTIYKIEENENEED